MRSFVMSALLIGFAVSSTVAQDQTEKPAADAAPPAAQKIELKTTLDRVSYGYGLNEGRKLASGGIKLDPKLVARGLADAFEGADPALTREELNAAFQEFGKEIERQRAQAQIDADPELKAISDKNLAEGAAFLKKTSEKEGVVTLKSGLQYEVLKKGKGEKSPGPEDTVTTHYHGTLIDGTVFDSSVDRGEPASFPVGGVIAGWTEALQLMKTGDKWKLYVPASLAYGLRSVGGKIGPNSTLVFEVELLSIAEQDLGNNE